MKKFALLTLAFTCMNASFAETKTTHLACPTKDAQAIEKVSKAYLDKNTDIHSSDVAIQSKQCSGNFAKAKIHPLKPVTDDALIYLKKVNNHWQVMMLGTGIDADLLKQLPKALQSNH